MALLVQQATMILRCVLRSRSALRLWASPQPFPSGNWQLRRAAEKIAIEQSWDAAEHMPPRELHGTTDLATVAAHLPQRVRVQGRFEHDRTIWLDNRALEAARLSSCYPFARAG